MRLLQLRVGYSAISSSRTAAALHKVIHLLEPNSLASNTFTSKHATVARLSLTLLKYVHAEQGEDRWDSGPEQGGLAKSHAARLLSELAGYEKLHPLMVRSGAAAALADRGEELVCCHCLASALPCYAALLLPEHCHGFAFVVLVEQHHLAARNH